MPPYSFSVTLDAYEIERADFERVLDGVRAIQRASESDLLSFEWLTEMIRKVGVVPIPESERTYADEAEHMNSSQQGLVQLPREFARYLLALGEHRPRTYLEIGCFNGGTACLAAAYLRRFHADAQAVTCDLYPGFTFYEEARKLLPWLRYEVGKTSFDLRGEKFEAVFIDGDHSFEWAWADYQNCGKHARLCAMHDVFNAPYLELHMGGAPAVWELIKRQEPEARFIEIAEHPTEALLGIGVRVLRS